MKKRLIFVSMLAFLGLFLFVGKTLALTVSPPIRELGGDPNSNVQGIIKLYNESNQEIVAYPSTVNFTAKENGDGEPEFLDQEKKEASRDMASWIKISSGPFVVKPLDWQIVPFEISIPEGAEPGGHYAAIFFSPNKSADVESGTVSVDYKAGSLILLSVSGEVRAEGKLQEFSLKNNQIFYEHIPVGFELRAINNGNIHFRPNGGIEIKNIFEGKVGELPILNTETGGNILPDSSRKYEVSWGDFKEEDLPKTFWEKVKFEKNNFRIGKYSALATIGFPGDVSESRTVTFWIFPWQLMLIVVLGLLIIVTLFRWYNHWIIKKAKENK